MEAHDLLQRIAASDGYRMGNRDMKELEKRRLITIVYCRDDGGCICFLSEAGMQVLNQREQR